MLTVILVVLAVIIVGLAVFIAQRPGQFRVTRAANIAAPPATVYAQVDNLRNWEAWSPWAKLDPAAKTSYEGPTGGVGSAFAWSGNRKIGQGRMTITESRPYEFIRFGLDFIKPFKGTNTAEFLFRPDGKGTTVTWTMLGRNNFIAKAIQLFMNCDKMVGDDFERGLAQLKSVAETEAGAQRAAA